jgi:hypothetical protein
LEVGFSGTDSFSTTELGSLTEQQAQTIILF